LVISFSGETLNLLPPDAKFKAKMHQIYFGWAVPQTLMGELTALLTPVAGFKGACF